jgi:hypothetical protein
VKEDSSARNEVSTTCVSRWIQESTPRVEYLTHPLTRVVLTSSGPSNLKCPTIYQYGMVR